MHILLVLSVELAARMLKEGLRLCKLPVAHAAVVTELQETDLNTVRRGLKLSNHNLLSHHDSVLSLDVGLELRSVLRQKVGVVVLVPTQATPSEGVKPVSRDGEQ